MCQRLDIGVEVVVETHIVCGAGLVLWLPVAAVVPVPSKTPRQIMTQQNTSQLTDCQSGCQSGCHNNGSELKDVTEQELLQAERKYSRGHEVTVRMREGRGGEAVQWVANVSNQHVGEERLCWTIFFLFLPFL